MPTIDVDAVHFGELEELARIGRATFIATFAEGNDPTELRAYLDRAFSIGQLEIEAKRDGSTFYFARSGKDILGYLKLNLGDAQTESLDGENLEIERIYVDARAQGKGVGKVLFDFAIKVARQAQLDAVWLGVWEKNLKAIEFYKRQGFVPFGEHAFAIGNDIQRDILMRIDLA